MILDVRTPEGLQVQERLGTDVAIWLTTVRADGQPQTSPVWFLWEEGQTVLIYSRPHQPKLRNIRSNPRVSLNLDGDHRGGDVVVIEGVAEIVEDAQPASEVPEYLGKYLEHIRRLGTEAQPFARLYSVAVRVTPTRLRVY